MGEVGQKYGSSLILSHFKQLPNGRHVLNIANTGLGEAVLLHGRRMEVLASAHFPSRSREEIARITEQAGFISEVRLWSLHASLQTCTPANMHLYISVLRCRADFFYCISFVLVLLCRMIV